MKLSLIGKQFGKLTVLSQAPSKNGKTYWLCQCACGNQKIIRGTSLTANNNTQSCGCAKKGIKKPTSGNHRQDYLRGRHYEDLSNQIFGNLLVLEPTEQRQQNSMVWKCQCTCGNIVYVKAASLKNKGTQSCGCIHSFGEQHIAQILQEHNINYIKEYNIKINNQNRRFDFAIIQNKHIIRLIEFDGPQHQTNKEIQQRDQEKNIWAKQNNIPLVRLPYNTRDTMTYDDLFNNNTYLVNI